MGKYQVLFIFGLLAIAQAAEPVNYFTTSAAYCSAQTSESYIYKIFSGYDGVCNRCSEGATDCSVPRGAGTSCMINQGYLLEYDSEDKEYDCSYYSNSNCALGCADFAKAELKCKTCQSGYALYNSYCYTCTGVTNCKTCATVDGTAFTCQTCNTGYYKDNNGACQKCGDNILSCSALNTDIVCQDGFYKNSNACTTCTANSFCKTCESATPGNCLTCLDGYYNDTVNKKCKQCPDGCAECTTGQAKCTKCSVGYGPKAGTELCSQCGNDQVSCTISNTNVITATVCETGYVLKNGACKQIKSNCKTVNNDGACTSCETGYFLNTGDCQSPNQIKNYCTTVTPGTETTAATCTACQPNRFLSSGNCATCGDNCKVCTAADTCGTCNPGYKVSGKTCVANTIANCLTDAQTTCPECVVSYIPNAQGTACEMGSAGTGIDGCTWYSGIRTRCLQCSEGKAPNAGKTACVVVPNFANCDYHDATTCYLCGVGYKLSGNSKTECVSCQTEKTCSSTTVCSTTNPLASPPGDNGDESEGDTGNIMHFSLVVLALFALLF